ncbi:MAG TPA: hypothetical protein VFU55_03005 [Terracidiphilus sp.]|nr:hypothetical protein [Terracidiphilus sp.]
MRLLPVRVLGVTGFASAAVVAISAILGGTKFEWLGVPFWAPGFFAAAVVFPQGAEGDHAFAYLVLVGLLNFLLTWIAALLLVKCLTIFKKRRD